MKQWVTIMHAYWEIMDYWLVQGTSLPEYAIK